MMNRAFKSIWHLTRYASCLVLVVARSHLAYAVDTQLNLEKFPAQMAVTRYGSADFKTATRILYQSDHGQFIPSPGMPAENLDLNGCVVGQIKNALLEQQAFPLEVMTQRLNYTPNYKEQQQAISLALNHDAIAFLQMFRIVPKNLWDGKTDAETVDTLAGHPNYWRVKTASMWTVAGQTLHHEAPFIRTNKLPWEEEPGADAIAGKYFDRKKYPFVSEWGRAGQGHPGEIDPLFSAAAASDYQRVRAEGGLVEDAYVSFSVDKKYKKNVRLYDGWFPNRRLVPPDELKNLGEAAQEIHYLVPLSEVMEKFPPKKYLQRISKIIELAGGEDSFPDRAAIELLNAYRLNRYDEVAFNTQSQGDQKTPLVIQDHSRGLYDRQYALFKTYRIPEEKWAGLKGYLQNFPEWAGNKDPEKYPDTSIRFFKELTQLKSVELSNLNGGVAAQDAQYTKAALLSSYLYYVDKFWGLQYGRGVHTQQVVQSMAANDTHFAITTSDPNIIRQAQALGAEKTLSALNVEGGMKMVYSFVFSMRKINQLIQEQPGFIKKYCVDVHTGQNRVQPGTRQAELTLDSMTGF